MMEREFVIAAFGDRRKQVGRLVNNIRQFVDWPINILTTIDSEWAWKGIILPDENIIVHEVERIWPKGTPRADIRNSNYHKILFAIANHYKSMCLLDDDMYILNAFFKQGFTIAEKFGAALPINPRTFTFYNMLGADVRTSDYKELEDAPLMFPAVNFSPFFVYPHASNLMLCFLSLLKDELRDKPCRGTIAIYKALWRTSPPFMPVILPEQWCVCASNAAYIIEHTEMLKGQATHIPTIMIHLGHEAVKNIYGVNDVE